MTVCAADLRLRDFSNYPLPCCSDPNQRADVRLFRTPYMIELQHTQIGFTAINAGTTAKILRNPAPIARTVARGVCHAPLIMKFFVSAIVSLAIFVLTCSAAASEAIAMLGKPFEWKQLMADSTLLHGKNRTIRKCHHYCTRGIPSSIY
jgi:hypothetical protein